jgi:hypothetical protein
MRGRRRLALSVIVGTVGLALVQAPAAADVVTRKDPKDTAGRLDIRRVSHGHAGEGAVTHTITTYRRFASRLLRPHGKATGVLQLWIDGDSDDGWWARQVVVQWRNGRLRAPIFDAETQRRVGRAKVTRPNRRSVKVAIKLSHLGDLGESREYFWMAVSDFWNQTRCKSSCWDFAPNHRTIRHRLPAPEPPEVLKR